MSAQISKILIYVNGLLYLGSSIDSVRKISMVFSEDRDYAVFLDEGGLGLIAIIAFGLGWLSLHLSEMFIKRAKLGHAKVAMLSVLSVLTALIALLVCVLFFVSDGFLKRVGYTAIYLIASGSFLRYSTFEDDRYLLSAKMFS